MSQRMAVEVGCLNDIHSAAFRIAVKVSIARLIVWFPRLKGTGEGSDEAHEGNDDGDESHGVWVNEDEELRIARMRRME